MMRAQTKWTLKKAALTGVAGLFAPIIFLDQLFWAKAVKPALAETRIWIRIVADGGNF